MANSGKLKAPPIVDFSGHFAILFCYALKGRKRRQIVIEGPIAILSFSGFIWVRSSNCLQPRLITWTTFFHSSDNLQMMVENTCFCRRMRVAVWSIYIQAVLRDARLSRSALWDCPCSCIGRRRWIETGKEKPRSAIKGEMWYEYNCASVVKARGELVNIFLLQQYYLIVLQNAWFMTYLLLGSV